MVVYPARKFLACVMNSCRTGKANPPESKKIKIATICKIILLLGFSEKKSV